MSKTTVRPKPWVKCKECNHCVRLGGCISCACIAGAINSLGGSSELSPAAAAANRKCDHYVAQK